MDRAALRQILDSRLGTAFDWRARPTPETVPSGAEGIELPRGSLTEIVGPPSSGRTSLLLSVLAAGTARQEVCALVDADDTFDPQSAAMAGICLERLLWVRCSHNAEHALKSVDLLVQGGGFGLTVLDLGDTPPATARRISLTSWFRLRRAVENTPTVLVVATRQPLTRTCASLVLECEREQVAWFGADGARLLHHVEARATSTRRSSICSPVFTAMAL